MKLIHHIAADRAPYKIALLVKDNMFAYDDIEKHYVIPLMRAGIASDDIVSISLTYAEGNKKPTVADSKKYLNNILKAAKFMSVKLLMVNDAHYFKLLAGVKKATANYGYVMDCVIEDYEDIKVVLGVNYGMLFHKPTEQEYLDKAIAVIAAHFSDEYIIPGNDVIHSVKYPQTFCEVRDALFSLYSHERIAVDIETFSLDFDKAKIGTIAFAWDEHNGIAIDVQHTRTEDINLVYKLLHDFFCFYTGKCIYHNAAFDIGVLIYELFMDDLLDEEGLQRGLEVMYRDTECTQIITYLATNTTSGNSLDLKSNVQEFLGNYAQDAINDITLIPLDELLEYNLYDCLGTQYLYDKNKPILIEDQQLEVYNQIFLPGMSVITLMELHGMPMNMGNVIEASEYFTRITEEYIATINSHPLVQEYNVILRYQARDKHNAKLKKKVCLLEAFDHVIFNPGSGKQLANLLHIQWKLPITDLTAKGFPSVKAKILDKHLRILDDPKKIELLQTIIDLAGVSKILNTFIVAFLKAIPKEDGMHYLHGSFKQGGTISGRLSSSDPNLTNLPSNSQHAEKCKQCFMAPKGWLWLGADFNSLEDMISALTTRDPNKLKVYEEHYDGHCLRAFSYFRDQLVDINDTLESINSIADKYPVLRQASKGPTFALTYGGTKYALINQCGLSPEDAERVEKEYHRLYKVADDWVADKLEQAAHEGYVTTAFGLRLRTPILKQILLNKRSTPYEGKAESRSAGNALGQGYGMLNMRASIEFQQLLFASPYRYDIKLICQIHDSQYYLVRNQANIVEWFNKILIKCMSWQELPELRHDTVKLGAEVEIFTPSWNEHISIPNGSSWQEIVAIAKNI